MQQPEKAMFFSRESWWHFEVEVERGYQNANNKKKNLK